MSRSSLAVALMGLACVASLWDSTAGPGWFMDSPLVVLLPAVAGYAVGVSARPVVAVPVTLAAVVLLTLANQWDSREYHWLDDLVFFTVVVAGPALAGAAFALRSRQVRALARLQAELEEQRRIDVAAARLEEQARVQQEVQAHLGERISSILVQAEGAQRRVDHAQPALAAIEDEARAALDDLRRTLGTLREAEPIVEPLPHWTSPRPRPSRLDLAIAVALGAGLAAESLLVDHTRGPAWANAVAALLVAAPLVVRRSRPVLAVALSMCLVVAMTAWLTPLPEMVTPIALMVVTGYAVGAWCRGRWWIAGLLVHWAGLLGMLVVAPSDPADAGDHLGFLIVLAWGTAATAVGRIGAGWTERLRRTSEAVAELEGRRDLELRLTTAQERIILASSLHDSVAHAMTVVCLQAAGAQRTGDPAVALETIARAASASLAELRDGLEDIDAVGHPLQRSRIAALGRRVGVDVAVAVPDTLPPGLATGLAFRVVREAVVNVARHAPGSRARVTVDLRDERLLVEVVDDGSAATRFTSGTGTGLTGLADALTASGGQLEWGPRDQGGFRVAGSIPVGAS